MVDSTATATAAAASIGSSRTRMADNFETFLTLLTTQLKNQDPTKAMDTIPANTSGELPNRKA